MNNEQKISLGKSVAAIYTVAEEDGINLESVAAFIADVMGQMGEDFNEVEQDSPVMQAVYDHVTHEGVVIGALFTALMKHYGVSQDDIVECLQYAAMLVQIRDVLLNGTPEQRAAARLPLNGNFGFGES